MSTFLLEIGTEELPADFARLALPQLEALVRRDLGTARLSHAELDCTSTPRRLAVVVSGLLAAQPDLEEERKGPPASQAFKDGNPTQAALGFASRCGVEPSDLEVRETPKGPFVFARCLEPGRPSAEVLAELIPQWLLALQGRRFMRWGEGDARFSRPLRWLVALLDADVIPLTLADCDPPISSGRQSRGHRLSCGAVDLPSADQYESVLQQAGVLVSRSGRSSLINNAVAEAAGRLSAVADFPPSLADELTDLVEAPLLIEGQIDDHYLALPAEVLGTVMRSHQRYVPLYRPGNAPDPLALDARDTLLSQFLCIGNGSANAVDTVRRGNERVLRARLDDAQFFVEADLATASIDRREKLARVTFAEGLGSLRDRTERLEWLTDLLLEQLALPSNTAGHARRAAHLCKHDLVSQMVGEFPELQGVMGGKYLLAEGEQRQVALAVLEHYLPRGAGDALPGSDAGAVVALAERLELLLSIYAKGERPSGSSDPYALRRAGNGILQILWDRSWRLDLQSVLRRSTARWSDLFSHFAVDAPGLAAELGEFLRQRLVSLLEEQGFDLDLLQAVAGEGVDIDRVLVDPADARARADLLAALRKSGELTSVQAVVNRAARLAEKGNLAGSVISPQGLVDPRLFEKASEAAMLEVLEQLAPIAASQGVARYAELARVLAASRGALAAFFDGDQSVMVLADVPAVRANRLNLLGVLTNQAAVLADFSRISG
ncbi:glycine--tRNA ligase subunit beta [Cyanobium sp. HWJ4-Hawea]|uniref:glycine--tRNA ligase subunit beta n=1 Tax=Cyanobium sp. HWJ4-Hawea TaxID=2823713 RepID=UPI0020CC5A7E|nr:glycine--tRNA ligase subunit beta [Cyanobium sp. HWJ4-Hawea]MCP9809118.1 glycine--tRNA ligase subunit beta [Cyanobium sp. HWJ4-Hawea]